MMFCFEGERCLATNYYEYLHLKSVMADFKAYGITSSIINTFNWVKTIASFGLGMIIMAFSTFYFLSNSLPSKMYR